MRERATNERPTQITGRFVLLPKNLVTGAAEAIIVVVRLGGPLPMGRMFLNRQLKPRSVGAFCPRAN
jgi:hypothetical protein